KITLAASSTHRLSRRCPCRRWCQSRALPRFCCAGILLGAIHEGFCEHKTGYENKKTGVLIAVRRSYVPAPTKKPRASPWLERLFFPMAAQALEQQGDREAHDRAQCGQDGGSEHVTEGQCPQHADQ